MQRDVPTGGIEYLIQASKKDFFNEKISKLREEYSEELIEYDNYQKTIDTFLNSECDISDFKKINKDELPEDIKTIHLEKIYNLISD
jgi:response regulator of citrate/malate metabolism